MNNKTKLKDYNRYSVDNQAKLQLELQEQLLQKLKELEESSHLLDSLKSLSRSKCFNTNVLHTSTRTGPYGYLPGLIGHHESSNSKLVQFGELGLLVLILLLWILSIAACLNRYSKLRTLYPVVPPSSNKGPMHIEEIKIIKNEQDAVIYKKIIPHKSSQATISRALKSSSAISANTCSSFRANKLRRSLSEPNEIQNAENTPSKLTQKNSIKYSQNMLSTTPTTNYNNNNNNNLASTNCLTNLNATQANPCMSIDSSRINILHKSNKPTYFSIDNYGYKHQDSLLFKRNDPKIISMKRSLFAKSKVNLFKTKDSLTSNHLGEELNKKNSIRSNKSGSLTQADTSSKLNPSELKNPQNSFSGDPFIEDRRNTLQDETRLLAPNWMSHLSGKFSPTTIQKIRENLMDLHNLITLERRPSLLQLSKISKSESNIKAHNKKSNDKLTAADVNKTEHKKPISLSLQNSNRSAKRYDFV